MTTPTEPDPRSPLPPGSLFVGKYLVQRPLDRGGMGTVYEVVQQSTGQPRALKVLHHHLALREKIHQRFLDEARIGTRIESDHVVQVIDAGVVTPEGVPWFTMELLRGETLEGLLRREGALTPERLLEVLAPVGHALAAAHRAGVVHCDLKPANLFVTEGRRADAKLDVKVLDFGIARVIPSLQTSVVGTSGAGTPGWAAPEQLSAGQKINPTTDVWALGLIAFRALAGVSYWKRQGQWPALLIEVTSEPLATASARAAEQKATHRLPDGFDAWFARCVARDVSRRFQDAAEALDALRSVLRPPPLPDTRPTDERALRVRALFAALEDHERRGDVEGRVSAGEQLVASGVTDGQTRARTAAAHVARAWSLEARGDREAALQDAQRAVELDPDAPQGHYLLGVIHLRRRDLVASLASLDRALALNPQAAGFYRERHRVHHLLGRYARALADADAVIERAPERAAPWVARAVTHVARRDLNAAEDDLTRALALEPGAHEALRHRAAVRVERGALTEALGDLDAALAISPGDGDCRFDRCRVRRLLGDTVGAHDDLRHAADLGHALAHHELRALGE